MKEDVIKRLMLGFLLAVLFLPAVPSWAADGGIDTTFGTGGMVPQRTMIRLTPLPSNPTARSWQQGIHITAILSL